MNRQKQQEGKRGESEETARLTTREQVDEKRREHESNSVAVAT